MPGRTYCVWHDPERQEAATASRRKGGLNRSRLARARRLLRQSNGMADVQALLLQAFHDVYEGDLDAGVATAMATLARAINAISGAASYEETLDDLHRQISEIQRRQETG